MVVLTNNRLIGTKPKMITPNASTVAARILFKIVLRFKPIDQARKRHPFKLTSMLPGRERKAYRTKVQYRTYVEMG